MKKAIIKGTVFGLVFFITLFVASAIINQGNNDMTMEMSKATFPLVYMEREGIQYNCLHGYAKPMDTGFERENISILGANRDTGLVVDTYGQNIQKLSYEVRSIDGERLIESTDIEEYSEQNDSIHAQIALKDLIEQNTEYCLVILLEKENGDTIRYYTRVVWGEDYHATEKLNFVMDFHQKTFDKEAAKELTKYLESNSSGNNTTYQTVNIHSSLNQVTWGDLEIEMESQPIVKVMELATQTGSFKVSYEVSTGSKKDKKYYHVDEFYRLRYTSERMYLLDYERTMEQYLHLSQSEKLFSGNKINLGIVDQNIQMTESEDGNIITFVNQGRLYSYHILDNKLTVLFSFYDVDNSDERTLYQGHGIKVLNVDEAGNVQFLVYGYMNRGRHEGDVGIQIYNYNSTVNTLEEAIYIPNDKNADILKREVEQLSFMNVENKFFFVVDNTVYSVDLINRTYKTLVENVRDGSLQVSTSNKMLVWQTGTDVYACQDLMLMDLNSEKQIHISAENGEYILPLGFMGEDLIYGLTRSTDIVMDTSGRMTFPMYALYIQDANGNILKRYNQEGIYITNCTINSNQIALDRVIRLENGLYEPTTDDQIMNNEIIVEGKNTTQLVATEEYEKILQIVLRSNIESKSIKLLTPKEVLFEGGRELDLPEIEKTHREYYVYGKNGVEKIFMNPANAVNYAYDNAGVVIGDQGEYVWIRGNRVSRNQIMAISASAQTPENNSTAVCLSTILSYEGVTRNTQYLLDQGNSSYKILQENLEGYQILNLAGCNLDAILYYVNMDIPVLALLNDGSSVLIVGFNEQNIVVMDPVSGDLYKKGMNDSQEWLLENGNYFITYLRATAS